MEGLWFAKSMGTVLRVFGGGLVVGPGTVVSLDTQGTFSVRGMSGVEKGVLYFCLNLVNDVLSSSKRA